MAINIQNFIDFVNSNPILKRKKINIYRDIKKVGWFGTEKKYHRFVSLFEITRKHYLQENKMNGTGDVLNLSVSDIQNFCQSFVNEYEQIKNHLNNLVV